MRAALIAIFLAALSFLHLAHSAQPTPKFALTQAAAVTLAAASGYAITSPSNVPSDPQTSATTTIVNQYITQPVIERTTQTTDSGVTETELDARLQALSGSLSQQLYSSSSTYADGGLWNAIAASQRINNLSGSAKSPLTISNVTVTNPIITGSVSGLTAADLPALSSLSGVLSIGQGGTGTSTAPGADELLLSDADGNWEYVATSSLGISTGVSLAGTAGQVAYFSGTNSAVGTSSLYISPAGNVGIGTTTPDNKLDIAGVNSDITFAGTNYGGGYEFNDIDLNDGGGFSGLSQGTGVSDQSLYVATPGVINFQPGDLPYSSLSVSGNGEYFQDGANQTEFVGQWPVDPDYNSVAFNGQSNGSGTLGLVGGANGDNNLYLFAQLSGGFQFLDQGTTTLFLSGNGAAIVGNDYASTHPLGPENGLLVEGHVGIGTTSPNAKLDISTGGNNDVVIGEDSNAPYSALSFNDSTVDSNVLGIIAGNRGDPDLYIQAPGGSVVTNGNATIAGKLTMSRCGDDIKFGQSATANDAGIGDCGDFYLYNAGSGGLNLENAGSGPLNVDKQKSGQNLNLETSAGTVMTLTSAGDVGIGTTTPSYPLTVQAGNGLFAGFGAALITSADIIGTGINLQNTSAGGQTWVIDSAGSSDDAPPGALGFFGDTDFPYLQIGYSSGNVGIGTNASPALSKLDVAGGVSVGSYAGVNGAPSNGLIVSGNVGVGTSTPYSRLTVWGPDTASTSAFAVINSASTTVFSVFDSGNATYSGSIFHSSDQRLKTDIQPLDASSSLAAVEALNPVSYLRLDQPGQGQNLGFLAQQVQQVFPQLVSTTSATALTPNGTLTLNYEGLIAPIVSAVQAISSEVQSLITEVKGFAQSFTSETITATNELCVNKSDGTPVCINGDQLASLLSGQLAVQISAPTTTISGMSSSTPPTITVNGDNPAIVAIGDSYADLGATVTDTGPGQAGDTNLGYQTFLNGTLVSNITLDTSQVATDTIDYVVTDNGGVTATSSRTVIVEAATNAALAFPTASSTEASSTTQ